MSNLDSRKHKIANKIFNWPIYKGGCKNVRHTDRQTNRENENRGPTIFFLFPRNILTYKITQMSLKEFTLHPIRGKLITLHSHI